MITQPETQLADILHQSFDQLTEMEINQFVDYYRLILKWNRLLHLTTITSPESFALRHIGEALYAENHILPSVSEFWDIGSGLGIPGIPVAIRRPSLSVKLVEAGWKKASFLREAAAILNLRTAQVLHTRLEVLGDFPPVSCASARAVEAMDRIVQGMLIRGAHCSQMLIFGNHRIRMEIERNLPPSWEMKVSMLPSSSNRLLIDISRFT